MPDVSQLSPAEALFLLKSCRVTGVSTIRVTLLSLLAKGILRIEEQQSAGLFRTKTVPYLRIAREPTPNLPPHVTVLIDLVQAAQADGGKIRDVVKRCGKQFGGGCVFYNTKFIAPALLERGFIEPRRVLFLRMFRVTPTGAVERQKIETDVAKARGLPQLLKSDPEQAVALAMALGGTLLLAEGLEKHYKQLADAVRSSDSGVGGDSGFIDSSTDIGDWSGGLDFGSFDFGVFDSLDASFASFDAGFSDSGGGGDGDSGGGGSHY
jgi:hypothetical protein